MTVNWFFAVVVLMLTALISPITFLIHKIVSRRKKISDEAGKGDRKEQTIWLEITKAILTIGLFSAAVLGVIGIPRHRPPPGPAWGIQIESADPKQLAQNDFQSGRFKFLTFRACWNDDACEPTAPGIQQDLECYIRRYPMAVESDGYDWHNGTMVSNPANIKPETRELAWQFATGYNAEIVRLIQQRDGECVLGAQSNR